MEHQITFGITKVKDKFAVCTDIETRIDRFNEPYKHKIVHYNLTYKRADFALKRAEDYVKSCYKPFTTAWNEKISFKFVNMGIIE